MQTTHLRGIAPLLTSFARFSRRWLSTFSRSGGRRRRWRSRGHTRLPAVAAHIERLEPRILLSCQQFFDSGTGMLTIEGDASANEVAITVLGDGSVEVVCDGGDSRFYFNVHTIDVSLKENDDRLTFRHNAPDSGSLPELNVDMGAGVDATDLFVFQCPATDFNTVGFQATIANAEQIQADAGNVPGVGGPGDLELLARATDPDSAETFLGLTVAGPAHRAAECALELEVETVGMATQINHNDSSAEASLSIEPGAGSVAASWLTPFTCPDDQDSYEIDVSVDAADYDVTFEAAGLPGVDFQFTAGSPSRDVSAAVSAAVANQTASSDGREGPFQLEGHQCLVFFTGGVQEDGSQNFAMNAAGFDQVSTTYQGGDQADNVSINAEAPESRDRVTTFSADIDLGDGANELTMSTSGFIRNETHYKGGQRDSTSTTIFFGEYTIGPESSDRVTTFSADFDLPSDGPHNLTLDAAGFDRTSLAVDSSGRGETNFNGTNRDGSNVPATALQGLAGLDIITITTVTTTGVQSEVEATIRGGEFRFLRDGDTLGVEIEGAEIHDLAAVLNAEPGSDGSGGLGPWEVSLERVLNGDVVNLLPSIELSDVTFVDSTPTIEMVGPRPRLALSDVEFRNSDLTVNVAESQRADDDPSPGPPPPPSIPPCQ